MKKPALTFTDFADLASKHQLTAVDYGRGHWQLCGGTVVNFYPSRGTIYPVGGRTFKGDHHSALQRAQQLGKQSKKPPTPASSTIVCQYCGHPAKFCPRSDHIYRRDYGAIYQCVDCDAYVGVHAGTKTPKGTLANAELRDARKLAHRTFDPLWQSGGMKRGSAYKWLAAKLGIPAAQAGDLCHIGLFNVDQCADVVAIVLAYRKEQLV